VGVITRGDLRRSVIAEAELPHSFRCTFCGSTRHVRPVPDQPGLSACLECSDRRAPFSADLYEEGEV
jgi:transcription elongation factor Elf1